MNQLSYPAGLLLAAACFVHSAQTTRAEDRLPAPADVKIEFARDVEPILSQHCWDCHGPDEASSELRLDRESATLAGGVRGPAVVPGKSADSRLIQFVAGTHKDGRMPPEGLGDPLGNEQVALLRAWIDQGAAWPESRRGKHAESNGEPPEGGDHWSFQPIVRSSAPSVNNAAWPRNDVDRFILARLEAEGVEPSPEADRYTLCRRLHLDLLGLPPEPHVVESFVHDPRPDAYERLVDRLLSSLHFGERWGRHWLDLARYADSDGYEKDGFRPHAWRFREWVVDAINADMPFDEFTIKQLAGDLLPNSTADEIVATGFHRQTLINTEGGVDQEEYRLKAVADRVNTTSTVWLGLTMGCAECHSHKYDPIPQTDYYRMFAFFNNADEAFYNYPASGEGAEKFREKLEAHQTKVAELQSQIDQARAEGADPFGKLNKLINERMRLERQGPTSPAGAAMVFREVASPRETFVHVRGDFMQRGAPVQPATPAVLHDLKAEDERPTRLDLARWIVDPENLLTARVVVNRVWYELFGRGLVATLDDFGTMGEQPTHPQLLDWLSVEFMREGWSRKELIRTIVQSAAYRQSSRVRPDLESSDPDNSLVARQGRYRVSAEVVRDLYLAVGDLLYEKLGGPSIRPPLPPSVAEVSYASSIKWEVDEAPERHRRGLYILFQRTIPYPSLMAFDCPEGVVTAVGRDQSNTPLQALTTMNDPVFFECTQALGRRLLEHDADDEARLQRAGQVALGRPLADREVQRLLELLHAEQERFSQHPADALDYLGQATKPENDNADSAENEAIARAAAWVSVASALMNLDEFFTRE